MGKQISDKPVKCILIDDCDGVPPTTFIADLLGEGLDVCINAMSCNKKEYQSSSIKEMDYLVRKEIANAEEIISLSKINGCSIAEARNLQQKEFN
jgi:hypothetical protein